MSQRPMQENPNFEQNLLRTKNERGQNEPRIPRLSSSTACVIPAVWREANNEACGSGFYYEEDKVKSARDDRSHHDKLLDYLLRLNFGNPYDPHGTEELNLQETYLEGFGGKSGCDSKYWQSRFQEEKHKVEDEPEAKDRKKVRHVFRSQDNSVFTHANTRVRAFFELGGYRAFPEVVTVCLEVREIFDIDVSEGTFRVGFVLTKRWYDRMFDKKDYTSEGEVYAQSIPYITFDHALEGHDPVDLPPNAAGLTSIEKHHGICFHKDTDPPGVLYESKRIQATFASSSDLRAFPFDTQKLLLTLRLWGSRVKGDVDHGRILIPLTCEVKMAHANFEWRVHQATTMVTRSRMDQQELIMILPLTRDPQFFLYNVYLILFTVTSASFLVFCVRPDDELEGGFAGSAENRLALTLTLILTSVAYKFYLEPLLPHAPYLTEIDWYIYGSFYTILSILIANCLTLLVDQSDERVYPRISFRSSGANETESDKTVQAVFVDNVFLYTILSIWICYNIFKVYKLRKLVRLQQQDLLKVISDEDKIRLNVNPGVVPDYVEQALKDNKHLAAEAQKERDKSVVYEENANTLHKRRAAALKTLSTMEAHDDKMEDINNKMLSKMDNQNVFIQKKKKKKPCDCTHCCHRHPPKENEESAKILQELQSFFIGANISTKKARELSDVFFGLGITKQSLDVVFNLGSGVETVERLLEMLEVDVANKVRVLSTLTSNLSPDINMKNKGSSRAIQATVLCLQGSSSYLVQGAPFKMNGQLIDINFFLTKLTDELNSCPAGDVKKALQDLSNQLYLFCLLQSSPLIKPEYVFSLREFKPDTKIKWTKDYTNPATVTTQVWSGYLVKRYEDKAWKPDTMGGAISIDIGTAKIAYGYAEVQKIDGKTVLRSYDLKDLEKQTDVAGIITEMDKIIEVMDCRYCEYPSEWEDEHEQMYLKFKTTQCVHEGKQAEERLIHKLMSEMQKHSVGDLKKPFTSNTWKDIHATMNKVVPNEMQPDINPENLKIIANHHYKFEMTDFDRIYSLCENLLDSIERVFDALQKVHEVQLTGNEPIFFFGTKHMRQWVKQSERKHGSRCHELLSSLEKCLNIFQKRRQAKRFNTSGASPTGKPPCHVIKLTICSIEEEAECEHKAFLVAFDSSDLDDKTITQGLEYTTPKRRNTLSAALEANDEKLSGVKIIKDALKRNSVGNLGYGMGSMQGIPNAKKAISCELGLSQISKFIEEEAADFGGIVTSEVNKKGKKSLFISFDNTDSKHKRKFDKFLRCIQQRITDNLKMLSPQYGWDSSWLEINEGNTTNTNIVNDNTVAASSA
eukprot:m.142695 g.142695  ORF g.142695 m.142695 type:complete len:1312 (+) comp30263_c0_seq1:314-4249(+)